jgi:ADP-ribose pyrophosphatase
MLVKLGGFSVEEGLEPAIIGREVVYATPWFELVAKTLNTAPSAPFYSVSELDYVSVLALTVQGQLLLVRQYRPAAEQYTLELPSGHVEIGQTPEEAARLELLEETGYQAKKIEFLGCLHPDTGRLGNRIWCFFAAGVEPGPSPHILEEGLEMLLCTPEQLLMDIAEGRFEHALHLAVVLLAGLKGKLSIAI